MSPKNASESQWALMSVRCHIIPTMRSAASTHQIFRSVCRELGMSAATAKAMAPAVTAWPEGNEP